MGRPMGSKNVVKVTKPVIVENKKNPVNVDSPVKVKPAEVKEEKKTNICKCEHNEDMHYGSPSRWCNTSGCKCQAFEF